MRPLRLRPLHRGGHSGRRPVHRRGGDQDARAGRDLGRHGGDPVRPCYHAACDTYANNSDAALDGNADAIAHAVITYAQNTEAINGVRGKGNFKPEPAGPSNPSSASGGGGGLHEDEAVDR